MRRCGGGLPGSNLFVNVGLLCYQVSTGLHAGLAQLLQVPLPVNQRVKDPQHQQPATHYIFVKLRVLAGRHSDVWLKNLFVQLENWGSVYIWQFNWSIRLYLTPGCCCVLININGTGTWHPVPGSEACWAGDPETRNNNKKITHENLQYCAQKRNLYLPFDCFIEQGKAFAKTLC